MTAKSILNSIEVLISKALIDSNIIHDEFVLMNNVLKEYDETSEEIKNFKFNCPSDLVVKAKVFNRPHQFIRDFSLFIKQLYHIIWSVEKIQKVKTQFVFKILKTKNEKIMLLSKCEMCDNKKIKIYERARS